MAVGRAAVSALLSGSAFLNFHSSPASLMPRKPSGTLRKVFLLPKILNASQDRFISAWLQSTRDHPWREIANAGVELCGPSNEGQQLGICKRAEALRTEHLGSCWRFCIKDLKSIPSAYVERANFFQIPRRRTTQPCSLTDSLMILSNMTSGGTWKSKTKY